MTRQAVVTVVVPTPLRRVFDYLPPQNGPSPQPGARVRVPFGRREVVGIALGAGLAGVAAGRLKRIAEVLDPEPLFDAPLLRLLAWAADYYQHPPGEVYAGALPVALRQGGAARGSGLPYWVLTDAGRREAMGAAARAPLRRRIVQALQAEGAGAAELAPLGESWREALRWLMRAGHVAQQLRDPLSPAAVAEVAAPLLGAAQRSAVTAITAGLGDYVPFLLHGVTGSGKTEVYLQAIAALPPQAQALVLVPEIALTPQLVARFRARFAAPIAVLHSGLNDGERLEAWLAARSGRARIVIGTRSAVFAPLARLALIVIDEEHDASYKQQDGFRYWARDVAVYRAAQARVPIVLGSATPSLETLRNAAEGRYRRLDLPERSAAAVLPQVQTIDLRRNSQHDGLSPPLIDAVGACLARHEQALVFLNRRGFAPALFCGACGWVAPCARCDAKLTLHRGAARLRCHHCGAEQPLPHQCPACRKQTLLPVGEGTERVEAALQQRFPQARIERIDRDSTRRKGVLAEKLGRAERGEADILVGTQMLAKGHDFPGLTLVAAVNADAGLYSVDFRAEEHLMQQLTQVAGRAGRADKPGAVLIQTHHPEHAVFRALAAHDYNAWAEAALDQRRRAGYPPYAPVALLRAEAGTAAAALGFLRAAVRLQPAPASVLVRDPAPSPMERRAGRYRAQLLLEAAQRKPLHDWLRSWLPQLEAAAFARQVRWSLDVDPVDLY